MSQQMAFPAIPQRAERMKNLRLTLGIPRTSFAALLGMTVPRLINRDRGVSPWQQTEIDHAKAKVAERIAAAQKALAALDA